MEKVSVGRIVHYVLANGEHRPAIIVRVWPGEFGTAEVTDGINVQIFTDGSNDAAAGTDVAIGSFSGEERIQGVAWRPSVRYRDPSDGNVAELMGTWHWPERVAAAEAPKEEVPA
jgi:hypothetical protein